MVVGARGPGSKSHTQTETGWEIQRDSVIGSPRRVWLQLAVTNTRDALRDVLGSRDDWRRRATALLQARDRSSQGVRLTNCRPSIHGAAV